MATCTVVIKAESSNSGSYQFLTPPDHRWEYYVFLSFRGDTRKTFTDHLYSSLKQAGINTFIDEEELRKGEALSSELQRAIQGSRISIIILSKGYASSWWCLDELEQILECKEKGKQRVLPVFYDVDPSEVRKQTGGFGIALAKHEERFGETKVKRWRDVLTKVGELSGWDLQQVTNGYESKFINEIIKEVSSIVEQKPIFVATYEVGLESRVDHVVWLMHRGGINDDVRFIGIYGMGGIGKTTLAKAVYNHVFEWFDSSCFLEIRSRVIDQHCNGIITLQQELLSRLLGREIKVNNVDEGIMLIKERLRAKKSLIVLDDLDNFNNLYALAGEKNWFGPGTRVILTTRDKHMLKDLKEDECYEVKELKDEDSLELFSLHTFKVPTSPRDYIELSKDVMSYFGRLPLALQVLGAYLSDKDNEEWRSALERLKKIPCNEVLPKLEISFDGLSSKSTKGVFLDLACCLPESIHRVDAISILEVNGYSPVIEIRDLIDKSLITIDKYGYLGMHCLIREMGWKIVYLESPNNPGEQSRLYCHDDIRQVLLGNKGTSKIEGIALNRAMDNIKVDAKAFKKMPNLRLLQIDHLHLHGRFKYLSKKLRWMRWIGCPLKIIPSDFRCENLVILDMAYSNIKEFQAPLKHFPCMKSLSFDRSLHLKKTPNFTGAHNLERLSFQGCLRLVDVHSSIGELERLSFVSFGVCQKLKKLPNRFFHLKSLETLSIDACPRLRSLEQLRELTSLKSLHAGDCSWTVSSNVCYLPPLTSLCSSGTRIYHQLSLDDHHS